VDVSFRTVTGVLVETRQNSEDGKQVWSIKLKKVTSPVEVVKQVEVPVQATVETSKGDSKTTLVAETIEQKIEAPAGVAVETKVVKLDIKSSPKKISSGEQLQKARVSIKNRRWNEAEKLLLELIEGPQDLAARTRLLSIYLQRQRAERFSTLVRESIDRYPQQALFKTEYARSLFQLRGYGEVIELLGADQDANATQLALLAASHQRLDQHQQAVDYYQQSLNKDARQSKNWIGLGISQEQTAQLEAALRSYATAAKIGKLNTRLQAFVDKRMEQLAVVVN
jgi:predicted Zn-dependent protease